MTAIQIGDVVSFRGRRWACMEYRPSPEGFPLNIWLSRRTELGVCNGIETVPGAVTLIERPTFTPGQRITMWDGEPGTILSDDGAALVQVEATRRRETLGGQSVETTGTTDCARGALTRDNYL